MKNSPALTHCAPGEPHIGSPSLYYTDRFVLPLPERHRFPMEKYRLLREKLVSDGIVQPTWLHIPPAATDEQLLRAHTADYVHRATTGLLTRREVQRMGFPWSTELVERSRRSVGATIAAARSALLDGFAVNLAGGTHHAHPDAAEGYCVFNDAVVAARAMQAEGLARRILIVDCDVHQGNGTAACTDGDENIFTVSLHGAKNFPARKHASNLDVPLPDGTGDVEYLAALDHALHTATTAFTPDLLIYVSGADPYSGDRLGRLNLSLAGLAARDRMVYESCRRQGVPAVATMAGGYCPDVSATVAIHVETVAAGLRILAGDDHRQTSTAPETPSARLPAEHRE